MKNKNEVKFIFRISLTVFTVLITLVLSSCSISSFYTLHTSNSPGHVHVIETVPAVGPTCETPGKTESKVCKVCKEVLEGGDEIPSSGHVFSEKEGTGKDPDCINPGSTPEIVCEVCGIVLSSSEVIPANGHEEQVVSGIDIPPTCEEEGRSEKIVCSICGVVLQESEIIPAKGHSIVIDPVVIPENGNIGYTEGSHCQTCGLILKHPEEIRFDSVYDAERYSNSYGYDYLKSLEKGEALTDFYNRLNEVAFDFHNDGTKNASENNSIGKIDYSDIGLSIDEAISVWLVYKDDHPLFYWISNTISYSATTVYFLCNEEYANGAEREKHNLELYNKIKEFVIKAEGETSAYKIAMCFHDEIIDYADYAYKEDGETPENAFWAHNILGIFDKRSAVCEGYALAFELLLNYYGIENAVVSGTAEGIGHSWNIVKLDDGKWYWCDVTWDDTPDWEWGISYNYFCVTDNEELGWVDGSYTTPSTTFMTSHSLKEPRAFGVDFSYEVPDRSDLPFKSDRLLLRDTFTINGAVDLTFAIAGFNKVAVTKIGPAINVRIPDGIIYDGTEYKVIAIGAIKDGLFKEASVIESSFSVYIPKSVKYIFNKALTSIFPIVITVDEENPYYTIKDGIVVKK